MAQYRCNTCLVERRVLSLEFLSFVLQRYSRVHGLHTKDLIIALFVVKHRSGKIVKHILVCQWTIRLVMIIQRRSAGQESLHGLTCIHSCQMKNL